MPLGGERRERLLYIDERAELLLEAATCTSKQGRAK